MTLVDASHLITPILKSGLLETDKDLQERMKLVEGYLVGYELKNPFKLNQFEILADEIEKAIRDLVDCFEKISSKN